MILLMATLLASLLGQRFVRLETRLHTFKLWFIFKEGGFIHSFHLSFIFMRRNFWPKWFQGTLSHHNLRKFDSTWIRGGSFLVPKRLPDQDFLHTPSYVQRPLKRSTNLFVLLQRNHYVGRMADFHKHWQILLLILLGWPWGLPDQSSLV